jgi:hypothetical protein
MSRLGFHVVFPIGGGKNRASATREKEQSTIFGKDS